MKYTLNTLMNVVYYIIDNIPDDVFTKDIGSKIHTNDLKFQLKFRAGILLCRKQISPSSTFNTADYISEEQFVHFRECIVKKIYRYLERLISQD